MKFISSFVLFLCIASNCNALDIIKPKKIKSNQDKNTNSACINDANNYLGGGNCVYFSMIEKDCPNNISIENYPIKSEIGNFKEFFSVFYCAIRKNKSKVYNSRIAYPLPYIVRDTEGTSWGIFKKSNSNTLPLAIRYRLNEHKVNLSYSTGLYTAIVAYDHFGSGEGSMWHFEITKEGHWVLNGMDIRSY